ncbi:MAG: hypothetical protein AVDCRST_MAG28-3752, partial [uncultured Rubrobacteraceae bacterium]
CRPPTRRTTGPPSPTPRKSRSGPGKKDCLRRFCCSGSL